MSSPNLPSSDENAADPDYLLFFDTLSEIPSLYAKAASKRELVLLPREPFKALEEVPPAQLPEASRETVKHHWLSHETDTRKILVGRNIDKTFLENLIQVLETFELAYDISPFGLLINHIGRLKLLLRVGDHVGVKYLNSAFANLLRVTGQPLNQSVGSIEAKDFAEEWIPYNQDDWIHKPKVTNYLFFYDKLSDIPLLFAKAASKRELVLLPREPFKALEEVPSAQLPEASREAVKHYWLNARNKHVLTEKILVGGNIDEPFLKNLIQVLETFVREASPFCFQLTPRFL